MVNRLKVSVINLKYFSANVFRLSGQQLRPKQTFFCMDIDFIDFPWIINLTDFTLDFSS